MVELPEEYNWSSYKGYIEHRAALIKIRPIRFWVLRLQNIARQFVIDGMAEKEANALISKFEG